VDSERIIKWKRLWQKIVMNGELMELEQLGFEHGEKQGKTMDVPLEIVVESLYKQIEDFRAAWYNYQVHTYKQHTIPLLKKTLADLRNVAGCVFLKLQETVKEH